MDYRQEWKYVCSEGELRILGARLEPLMEKDVHLSGREAYNIRSIYLDDCFDTFMQENEAGLNDRMKFRLRIYDRSSDVIKAEIKYKKNGMTRKQSASVSEAFCRGVMAGEPADYSCIGDNAALNLLTLRMHDSLLRPKVIVEYDRTVFVSRAGNVRITFDRNIRASHDIGRFFEADTGAVAVLPPGMHVLEVKFDELIPDEIAHALELNTLRQSAFSKYYLSRMKMKEYGYDI